MTLLEVRFSGSSQSPQSIKKARSRCRRTGGDITPEPEQVALREVVWELAMKIP